MKHAMILVLGLGFAFSTTILSFADDALKARLEKLVTDAQSEIDAAEPVFRDEVFLQWARLTFGIRHMTYIVDTRNPERVLGIVTFTCKVTQSDFFATKKEAQVAPIKNMIPQLIPCRATYEWKVDRWEYLHGATYVRKGDWKPIPTDKPNAFPQLYFNLMRNPKSDGAASVDPEGNTSSEEGIPGSES